MGLLGAGFSVSLDGFVAEANDDTTQVFSWYFAEPVDLKTASLDDLPLTEEASEMQEERGHGIGAIISGRRTFDTAQAWGGNHPLGVPVVVLTHNAPTAWANDGKPFTFITEGGVERAVELAQQIAGDKSIGVTGPDTMQQCIKLGLLDEIGIDLVPVLLGQGVPLFKSLGLEPMTLEKVSATDGPAGVTHLRYKIVK